MSGPPAPPPEMHSGTTPAVGRNGLAIFSLSAGLYPVLVLALSVAAPVVPFLRDFVGVLVLFTVPAIFIAIITGHIALVRAKRYPNAVAHRGLAIAGLVLGYLEVAIFLLFVALIIIAFRNG